MSVANDYAIEAPPARRRYLAVAAVPVVVALSLILIASQRGCASVQYSELSPQDVQSGAIRFSVAATGKFVPRVAKVLTAPSAATVRQVLVASGTPVKKGQLLVSLVDPTSLAAINEARLAVVQAESALLDAKLSDTIERDKQAMAVFDVQSDLDIAKRGLAARTRLADQGILSKFELEKDVASVAKLEHRLKLETASAKTMEELRKERVSRKEDELAHAREVQALAEARRAALEVHAEFDGVVQGIEVTAGQALSPGQELLRIATANDLLALLDVPQSQANALQIGAPGELVVQQERLDARVTRIDSSVRDGVVQVELALEQPPAQAVRADQMVAGEIEATGSRNGLYMKNTEGLVAGEKREVFVLEGDVLKRRTVSFGGTAGDWIEILAGAKQGERLVMQVPAGAGDRSEIRVKK